MGGGACAVSAVCCALKIVFPFCRLNFSAPVMLSGECGNRQMWRRQWHVSEARHTVDLLIRCEYQSLSSCTHGLSIVLSFGLRY